MNSVRIHTISLKHLLHSLCRRQTSDAQAVLNR